MKYKFLDHTADILFEAYGKTLEELFVNSALAVEETQINLKTINPTKTKKIILKNDKIDMLLFKFLEEIIFLKDSEQLLFSKFKIKINKKRKYFLEAICQGEELNLKKHKLGVDIKAITFYQFEVKQIKDKWKARIILDI